MGALFVADDFQFGLENALVRSTGGPLTSARSRRRLRAQLERPEQDACDREMHLAELFSPATAATLRFRGEPYGLNGGSRFELYGTVSSDRLGDEVAQIATPIMISDPEDEQFWPGQSQQLYDRLPGQKRLVTFTVQEGAGRHGEPHGDALRETRIFDWLDQYLA